MKTKEKKTEPRITEPERKADEESERTAVLIHVRELCSLLRTPSDCAVRFWTCSGPGDLRWGGIMLTLGPHVFLLYCRRQVLVMMLVVLRYLE